MKYIKCFFVAFLLIISFSLSSCRIKSDNKSTSAISNNNVKQILFSDNISNLIAKPEALNFKESIVSIYDKNNKKINLSISDQEKADKFTCTFLKWYEPIELISDNNYVFFGKIKYNYLNGKSDSITDCKPFRFECLNYAKNLTLSIDWDKSGEELPKDTIEMYTSTNEIVETILKKFWKSNKVEDLIGCWGQDDEIYYEGPNSKGNPCIYKYIVKAGKGNNMYKDSACYPSASADGKVFSYWQTDVWQGKGSIEQKMIIEGNGKKKEYSTLKVVKFDSAEKEIYVIDEATGALEVLNQDTFEVKAKGNLDKDFLFPQIVEGKLQYTCPIRNGKEITDYKVVEEN